MSVTILAGELRAWFRICISRNKKNFAMLIPFSIWIVWEERNRKAFDGIDTQDRMVIDRWVELVFLAYRDV